MLLFILKKEMKYGKGGRFLRYARTAAAVYPVAKSAYHYLKTANNSLREAQRSAVKRSHPRDFLVSGHKKRYVDAPPSPPPESRGASRRRNKGASYSQSAGKLRTSRKSRKPRGWQAGKGCTFTVEGGGIVTASNCLHIGHATGGKEYTLKAMWKSVIKLLVMKMNIRIREYTQLCTFVGCSPGDQFRFNYMDASDSPSINDNTYTLTALSSWDDIVNSFYVWTQGAVVNWIDINPISFEFLPAVATKFPFSSISCETLMLHYEIKSDLKIQNRTISTAENDQADDVDNVPVYGTSIGGKGTGTTSRFPNSSSPAQIVGSNATGLIRNTALDNGFQEPQSAYFWPKSQTQGKLHLDPGQIKTSVLSTRRSVGMKTLLKMFYNRTTAPMIVPFGQFRFFQIEKMIDVGGTAVNINVAFEINTRFSCYAKAPLNFTTSPQFIRVASP